MSSMAATFAPARTLTAAHPRAMYQSTDQNPTLKGLHYGQRKLLLSEIEYITALYNTSTSSASVPTPTSAPSDSVAKTTKPKLFVYAGAANGSHLPTLFNLFPDAKFVLVDPAPFCAAVRAIAIVGGARRLITTGSFVESQELDEAESAHLDIDAVLLSEQNRILESQNQNNASAKENAMSTDFVSDGAIDVKTILGFDGGLFKASTSSAGEDDEDAAAPSTGMHEHDERNHPYTPFHSHGKQHTKGSHAADIAVRLVLGRIVEERLASRLGSDLQTALGQSDASATLMPCSAGMFGASTSNTADQAQDLDEDGVERIPDATLSVACPLLELINGFCTDTICARLDAEYGDAYDLHLISDVRLGDPTKMSKMEATEAIMRDNRLQESWAAAMRASSALLKFHPPYARVDDVNSHFYDANDNTPDAIEYLAGSVLFGVWAPKSSTEVRLFAPFQWGTSKTSDAISMTNESESSALFVELLDSVVGGANTILNKSAADDCEVKSGNSSDNSLPVRCAALSEEQETSLEILCHDVASARIMEFSKRTQYHCKTFEEQLYAYNTTTRYMTDCVSEWCILSEFLSWRCGGPTSKSVDSTSSSFGSSGSSNVASNVAPKSAEDFWTARAQEVTALSNGISAALGFLGFCPLQSTAVMETAIDLLVSKTLANVTGSKSNVPVDAVDVKQVAEKIKARRAASNAAEFTEAHARLYAYLSDCKHDVLFPVLTSTDVLPFVTPDVVITGVSEATVHGWYEAIIKNEESANNGGESTPATVAVRSEEVNRTEETPAPAAAPSALPMLPGGLQMFAPVAPAPAPVTSDTSAPAAAAPSSLPMLPGGLQAFAPPSSGAAQPSSAPVASGVGHGRSPRHAPAAPYARRHTQRMSFPFPKPLGRTNSSEDQNDVAATFCGLPTTPMLPDTSSVSKEEALLRFWSLATAKRLQSFYAFVKTKHGILPWMRGELQEARQQYGGRGGGGGRGGRGGFRGGRGGRGGRGRGGGNDKRPRE